MSLEGQLEDLGLADIIQILSLSKRSGELSIRRQQDSGYVIFSRGQIIFGSAPSVGPFGLSLAKKGIISQEVLTQAVGLQKQQSVEKPIGTILHEIGVDKEILEKELRSHMTAVVRELLSWRKGFFHFELGAPGDDSIILSNGMSAEYLLLEGARMSDEEGKGEVEEEQEEETSVRDILEPSPVRTPTFQDEIQRETSIEKTARPEGEGLRKDLQLLNTMIDELSSPSSGGEVILLILRFASELLNRGLVFLVKKEEVWGWGQCGIVLAGKSPDEEIRKIRIPLAEESVFKTVFQQKTNFKGPLEKLKWHSEVVNHLGGEWPGEVFVGPIMNEGRVIAFLYGDNLPMTREIGEVEGLETFLKIAGYAFGKMMLEKKGK
ncbi:MAG: DUF4388 domain-containing protein [Nitrospirae bacterium]|nr:DUF4388 domain-containing protein [Nitrospirota bacterium]